MDDLALQITKLTLAPGDVLVLQSDRPISIPQVDRLREHLSHACPGTRCLILDNGMDLSVLTREDIAKLPGGGDIEPGFV